MFQLKKKQLIKKFIAILLVVVILPFSDFSQSYIQVVNAETTDEAHESIENSEETVEEISEENPEENPEVTPEINPIEDIEVIGTEEEILERSIVLKCKSVNETDVQLEWETVGEFGEDVLYECYRNGELIGTVSELHYKDDTVQSGVTYYYVVKAVGIDNTLLCVSNNIEVNSFEHMVIVQDTTLSGDMEVGNLTVNLGNLNLNGYKLTVHGNVIINNGTIKIDRGFLDCHGSFSNRDYGGIIMDNINDYVLICGDFNWNGYSTKSSLTKGTLEVKGNYSEINNSVPIKDDSFSVILSGSQLQTITLRNYNTGIVFPYLELQNYSEEGIYSKQPFNVKNLHRNGCKIRYGVQQDYQYGWTLSQDQIIDGDLYLMDDTLDLNGYTLMITGNLVQISGKIDINNGQLVVEKDYRLQNIESITNNIVYAKSAGALIMNDEGDRVIVKGSFYNNSIYNSTDSLTNGTLIVGKDFVIDNTIAYSFVSTQSHKVVLNGSDAQSVNFKITGHSFSRIANLWIQNSSEEGVTFANQTTVTEKIQTYDNKYKGIIGVTQNVLSGNNIIGGTICLINQATISDNVEIKGSLILDSVCIVSGKLRVAEDVRNGQTSNNKGLVLNNGSVIIDGSLNLTGVYSYQSTLSMTNENDYLCIKKNLSIDYNNGLLTNGVLEAKGNFTVSSSSGLNASGNHKVLLSGTERQIINIHNDCEFNILEITNNSAGGIHSQKTFLYNKLITNGNKIVYGNTEGVFGWTLSENETYEGDLILTDDTLDLNGYTLTITGNFIQMGGLLDVNNGCLIVEKDYRVQTVTTSGDKFTYGTSTGRLKMINEYDKVIVKGSFVSSCSLVNSNQLTNGTMMVAGDFTVTSITSNNFVATDNHLVILNGDNKQTISLSNTYMSGSRLANLRNDNTSEEGITIGNGLIVTESIDDGGKNIKGTLRIGKDVVFSNSIYHGNIDVIGGYTCNQDLIIAGDMIISTSIIIASNVKVNGSITLSYNLKISGSMTIEGSLFANKQSSITMDKGSLVVKKNMNLGENSGYYSDYMINMTNDNDYICVYGNFYNASRCNITNGVLEVKGDITQTKYYMECSGKNKVILSGDKKQTITFTDSVYSTFHILEIQNSSSEGVHFATPIRYNTLITNGNKITTGNIESVIGWTLESDEEFYEDIYISAGYLDLNGHTLIIHGDLVLMGGNINLNHGDLIVTGNLRIQMAKKSGETISYGNSTGYIIMSNSDDKATVKGDMIVSTITKNSGYMTNGVLEIGGDLNVANNTRYDFVATDNHKIVFNGTKAQTIFLESTYPYSTIANVDITNTSIEGVLIKNELTITGQVDDEAGKLKGNVCVTNTTSSRNGIISTNVRMMGGGEYKNSYVIKGDLLIPYDTKLSGDYYVNGQVNMGGQCTLTGTLTAEGDIFSSQLILSKGKIIAKKNFNINSASDYYTQLYMSNPEDSILIEGDFNNNARRETLTNGVIIVKGNYKQDNSYSLTASYNHRIVFAGDKLQTIEINSTTSKFNIIELTNKSKEGIYSKQPIGYNELITNGCKITIGDGQYSMGWTLLEDQVIESNLLLGGGTLDLNGHTLSINGDFVHVAGIVNVNGGNLIVNGDYRLQDRSGEQGSYIYDICQGILQMKNKDDVVTVHGNFITNSNQNHSNYLTDGLLQIAGDFEQVGSYYNFYATGNHATKFIGTKAQSIYIHYGYNCFNHLIIDNKSNEKVTLKSSFSVNGNITDCSGNIAEANYIRLNAKNHVVNNTWSGSLVLLNSITLTNDFTVGGTLTIQSSLRLSEYTLAAKNISLSSAYLYTDKGRVSCFNDMNLSSYSSLIMNQPEAYVLVGGNFYCYTSYSMNGSLTEGTLEIRGDFLEEVYSSFIATGNHTTILSGKAGNGGRIYIQTIDFFKPGTSKFNKLILTKELQTGYNFIDPVEMVCNTLVYDIKDQKPPKTVQNIKIKDTKATEVILEWDAAEDNIGVVGYQVYRNNDKVATVSVTTFRDTGLEANKTYNYKIYAFDQARNMSEPSVTVTATTKPDTEAPAIPTNLSIKQRTGSSIVLSWTHTVDNVKVKGYEIYRDGKKVGTTTDNSYHDKGLQVEKAYDYTVIAFDASNNYSKESNKVTGSCAMPKITTVSPTNFSTIGGDKVSLSVYFLNVGNSVGNKILMEYSYEGDTWIKINPNYLGQNIYSSKEFYATYTWDISNIEQSGDYRIKYTLYDAENNKDEKIVTYRMDKTPPKAPSEITATADSGTIFLRWHPSTSADVKQYTIYRKSSGDFMYQSIAILTDLEKNTFVDNNVIEGKEYSYKITATDKFNQESEAEREVHIVASKDTSAPYITSILPRLGRLNQTAKITVEAVDNIAVDKISLYYQSKGENNWILLGEQNVTGSTAIFNWNTTVLTGTFNLKAIATDRAGNKSREVIAGDYTIDNVGISKITGVKATVADTYVKLEWNDVQDNDFSYFAIEQKNGSRFAVVGTEKNTLGYYVQNLTTDKEYTFRIVGYDDLGNRGIPSDEITIKTSSDKVAPVIRQVGPVSSRYKGTIKLTMTVTDNVGSIKGRFYSSYDKENWDLIEEVKATSVQKDTSYTCDFNTSKLKEGSVFVFFEAEDAKGNKASSESKVIAEYIIDRTAPSKVSNFKAEGLDGYISLTWDTGEDDIKYYNIYRAIEDGIYNLYQSNVRTKNYYDTQIEYNTPYSYKIEAVDIAGNVSELSDEALASGLEDNKKPIIHGTYPANTDKICENPEIQVSITDNNRLAKITVEYKEKTSTEDIWYKMAEDNLSEKSKLYRTTWNTKGLEEKEYELRFQVTDAAGNVSDYTKVRTTLDLTAPKVQNFTLKEDNWNIKLSWDMNTENDFSYYQVWRKSDIDSDFRVIATIKTNSYNDSNASPDYDYIYKIIAYDKAGNRSESLPLKGSPNNKDTIKPVARATNFIQSVVDEVILLDGTASSDNIGILNYTWDMGDGTKLNGPTPVHAYQEAGEYTITLTVSDYEGNKDSCSIKATIYKKEEVANTTIKVVDTNGVPLRHAIVYVQLSDGIVKNFLTNYDGIVNLYANEGNVKIAAYLDGYLPSEINAIFYKGGNNVTLTLQSGELIIGDLSIRRMTLEEMVVAGIDLSNPINMESFIFSVQLKFEKEPIPTRIEYNIIGGYGGSVVPISINDKPYEENNEIKRNNITVYPVRKNDGANGYDDVGEVPVYAYVNVVQSVSWLKDFYQVDLGILNNATPQFTIEDCEATIDLPREVSLASTKIGQTKTQSMGTIAGQQRKQVSWYITSDFPGTHKIKANFSGNLMPFNIPVSAKFEEEQTFTASGKGLHIYVMPESAAYINDNYYVQFMIRNDSSKVFYNLSTSFGPYIDPGQKNHIRVTDRQSGQTMVYNDGYIAPTYRIDYPSECTRVPILYGGETLSVGVFGPGEVLYGTYTQVFSAEGDPDTEYYKLVDSVVTDLSSKYTGVEVHVNPIDSHITRYNVDVVTIDRTWADPIDYTTGAYLDSYDALSVVGGTTLSFELDYNSICTSDAGDLGYGWSHSYENYIVDRGAYVNFYSSPSTFTTFIAENAINRSVNGMIINNDIILNTDYSGRVIYKGTSYGTNGYTLIKEEDGTYTLILPNGNSFYFSVEGYLTKIVDANGKTVTLEHSQNQTIVTEPLSGQRLKINYNDNGLVTNVSDDHGRITTFSYQDNYLIAITNPLNEKTFYSYDENGRIKTVTNHNGIKKIENTYDDKGRVLTQDDSDATTPLITMKYEADSIGGSVNTLTDRNGGQYIITIDRRGNITRIIDPIGGITDYSYNEKNQLIFEKNAAGGTIYYEYDLNGNCTIIKDSHGNITRMTYDEKGNVTSVIGPTGATSNYTYNDKNLLVKEVNELGRVTEYTYNESAQLLTQTVDGKGIKRFTYENGFLTQTTDYLGNKTTYTYDSLGNLSSATTAEGETEQYEYDALGRMIKLINPYGKEVNYTFDCDGNQSTITDANGNVSQFTYQNGYLTEMSNAQNKVVKYAYDGEGNALTFTHADDKVTESSYDKAGNVIRVKLPDGSEEQYKYDTSRRLTEKIAADKSVTRFEYYSNDKLRKVTYADGTWISYNYTSNWNLRSTIDSENRLTTYEYDAAGNTTCIVNAAGDKVQYEYDKFNNLIKETDALGNITRYEYDANGNCIKKINALNEVAKFEYDKNNRLTKVIKVTSKGDVSNSYEYDKLGRVWKTIDALGNTFETVYDSNGNVIMLKDALGNIIATNEYDSVNNLIQSKDAMGITTSFKYDQVSNLIETIEYINTDAARKTTYSYDKQDRLLEVTDAINGVSKYTYDEAGNISTITDPMGGVSKYEYDNMGRVTLFVNDVLGETSYSYNTAGLLKSMTNGRKQTTYYEYDVLGRLTKLTDEVGTITYKYDKNGNITEVTDEKGTIKRTYDKLNRVKKYTDYKGNTINYSYDELGNLISLTYPGGNIVRYEYYNNGNLKTVTDAKGRLTSYTYDANGRLKSVKRPDGSYETYDYDLNGRLTRQDDVNGKRVINSYQYSYDSAGNVISITNTNQESGQLIKSATMTYDKGNRLTSYNGQAVIYDADGNMTYGPLNGQMATYEYDCRNRLIKAGDITYEYDAENQRIAVNEPTKRLEYVINSNATLSQVLQCIEYSKLNATEYASTGKKTEYIYGQGLIAEESADKGYRTYHYNNIGNTTAITNEKGVVLHTYTYGPYGELLTGEQDGIQFLYNGQ